MTVTAPSKRVKLSPASSDSARIVVVEASARVLSTEPVLLHTILSFVVAPESDTNGSNAVARHASAAVHAIATLCRALPGLSRRVGPSNVSFWRAMVLGFFDFTIDASASFNVDDDREHAVACVDRMRAPRERDDGTYEDVWATHPVKPFIDAWDALQPSSSSARRGLGSVRMPPTYLRHDLAFWSRLTTHFRPVEYGFLGAIQQNRTLEATQWPPHEDAFSLFCELAIVTSLDQPIDNVRTFSNGDVVLHPVLLGRFEAEIPAPGYALLEFCDFYPHFWDGHPPVTETWTGLAGAPPSIEDDGTEAWEYEYSGQSTEEQSVFPVCTSRRRFVELRRLVYDRCSDWRRVDVNTDEYWSPAFFIGKSKTSSRWFGYVGLSG